MKDSDVAATMISQYFAVAILGEELIKYPIGFAQVNSLSGTKVMKATQFLYCISDPSHIIKRARNYLTNEVKMSKEGQAIDINFVKELITKEKSRGFFSSGLNEQHVILTARTKMRVSLANNIFTKRVYESTTNYLWN